MPQTFVLPRQVAVLGGVVAPNTVATFFQTGTSTPQAVYTDAALSNAVTSITADAAGVFAKVYLNPSAAADYRVTITPTSGSPYTEDNISRLPVSQGDVGAALYPRTTSESSAGITPSNYAYPESNVMRYGALGDRTTDDLAAFNRAASVAVYTKKVFIPALQAGYYYRLSGAWVLQNLDSVEVYGEGTQSLLVIANNAGANCITVDSTVHARFHHFGIYGTDGSGHGIELINSSHYNEFHNIWIGWVDGDAYRNTLGISNRLNSVIVDQNSGYRPATLVGGLTDGSIKRGLYWPSTVTGLNNDGRCVNCVVNAAGETASLQVGDNGGTVVESFSFISGLLQGASSEVEAYLHTRDGLIDCSHLENSVGTQTAYIVTLDACTNTHIRLSGVNGDVRLIGACQQSGLSNVRVAGVDIGASTDRCFVENSSYGIITDGPGGGVIKDRALRSRLDNLINASNDRFATGISTRNSTTYFQTNMEDWVGGGSPTVPCGLASFGTPTITRKGTVIRSGTYSAKVVHSSELNEGLSIAMLPVNQFAGRQITVEAWVYNLTTAGLGYISMLESGVTAVHHGSYLADTWERMAVTFKVDSAASAVAIRLNGLVGTVYWDSVKITCEEHAPVMVRTLDGTATPSVSYGGYHVPLWVSSGTPTITNFLEPHVGKPFTIRFAGATVITDSDPIFLAGAGNFTGAAGNTMTLIYGDDGKFREISRVVT